VLFIDAARAEVSVLRASRIIPQRMLLFGLPGTIALGFAAGLLIFEGLSMYELAFPTAGRPKKHACWPIAVCAKFVPR
jgi:hypothetical protein